MAFVLELDAALQDVDELEVRPVQMRLAGELLAGGGPDDVGDDPAVGSLLDAEIAVLEERSQATIEDGIPGVRSDEALRGHGAALPKRSVRGLWIVRPLGLAGSPYPRLAQMRIAPTSEPDVRQCQNCGYTNVEERVEERGVRRLTCWEREENATEQCGHGHQKESWS